MSKQTEDRRSNSLDSIMVPEDEASVALLDPPNYESLNVDTTPAESHPEKTRQMAVTALLGAGCVITVYAILLNWIGFAYCSKSDSSNNPPPNDPWKSRPQKPQDSGGCSAFDIPTSVMFILVAGVMLTFLASFFALVSGQFVFAKRGSCQILGGIFGAIIYILFSFLIVPGMPLPARFGQIIFSFWITYGLEVWLGWFQKLVVRITALL